MTKEAIVRRQCKRAMRTLIRRWPDTYSEDCFEIIKEKEWGRLPGTAIYWTAPDYWGEADESLAVDELRWMETIEETNWDREAHIDYIRAKYGDNRKKKVKKHPSC